MAPHLRSPPSTICKENAHRCTGKKEVVKESSTYHICCDCFVLVTEGLASRGRLWCSYCTVGNCAWADLISRGYFGLNGSPSTAPHQSAAICAVSTVLAGDGWGLQHRKERKRYDGCGDAETVVCIYARLLRLSVHGTDYEGFALIFPWEYEKHVCVFF